MLKKSVLIATLVGVAVTGCGNSNNQTNSADKKTDNQSNNIECPLYATLISAQRSKNFGADAAGALKCSQVTQNTEKPNINTPDASYTEINSGKTVLWAYYASYPNGINYEKIAEVISPKYQSANDAFKKQEIIDQLKPEIDNNVAAAKANKYYYNDIGITLHPYDLNTHSFSLYSDALYGWSYNNTPSVTYLNSKEFMDVKVDDIEVAKRLEALRASNKLRSYVFAYMNNVSLDNKNRAAQDTIYATIIKIEYKDPSGNLIYTQYSN